MTKWVLKCALSGAALALMCTTTTIIRPAQAQGAQVEVLHQVPDLKTIGTGRAWVPITLELRNTREINLKVRLVGSRDGRFMDVMLPKGSLNNEDRPTYQTEIPAPTTSMSYQFIIHQPDGSLVTSKRYEMQRGCVQNFKIEIAPNDPNADFKKKVAEIIAKAGSLERDLAYLDAATKVVDELKQNIPN